MLKRRDVEAREPAQRTRPRITGQSKHAPPPWDKENTRFGCHLKARPREHSPEGALSNAFVRNVAQAGRYCDGDSEQQASGS